MSLPGLQIPRLDLATDTIDEFDAWQATIEAYFEALGIQASENDNPIRRTQKRANRRACMLNSFSSATFNKYKNLPLTEDQLRDPEAVIQALREHLIGQVNVIVERNHFWTRQQKEGESFADYIMELRDLMRTCAFCEHADDLLRDKIVLGVRNPETVKRLLAQPQLTLAGAITICQSEEASSRQRDEICKGNSVSAIRASTYKKAKHPGFSKVQMHRSSSQLCGYCGKARHSDEPCPARDKLCRRCGKKGHFDRVCRSKNVSASKKTSDGQSKGKLQSLVALMQHECPLVEVRLQETELTMMPDTGSNINAIRAEDMRKLTNIKVEAASDAPMTANGQKMKAIGKFNATLCIGSISVNTVVYVLEQLTTPVLSWKTCKDLGIIPQDFPKQHISAVSMDEDITTEEIMKAFPMVFDGKVRPMKGEAFKIKLNDDSQPFSIKTPRRVPFPLYDRLKEELDSLEAQEIICKVTSPTPWCAPIVVAPKKDDGIRLCVDFRELNKYVIRPRYQSQTPLEIVASTDASRAKYFTVVDALKGYHQIPLDKESMPLTTFITPFGRYMFRMAPFGISSISEFYNQRLDDTFQGLRDVRHVVDDCLIASSDKKEHVRAVKEFLERCRDHGVALNRKKFVFCKNNVDFAGFRVSADGYSIDPGLVKAISEFPTPTNITDLRAYFGLVNQVGTFTPDIAEVTAPLRPLLSEKNMFLWADEHQKAFEESRFRLANTPTLAYYDQRKMTALHTDASRLKGIGFLLKQRQTDGSWRVVQAGSRYISDTESRYAMIELELLAVVWATQKCRLFLEGLPQFEIITDHKPLIPILNHYQLDQIENPRIQRLRAKLDRYAYTARWVKGKDNADADALSRAPVDNPSKQDELGESAEYQLVNQLAMRLEKAELDPNLQKVQQSTVADQDLQDLIQFIRNGFPNDKGNLPLNLRQFWHIRDKLTVDDGIILHGCRCVIPRAMRKQIVEDLHSSHQGLEKTKQRARMIVYWPGIDRDIENAIKQCRSCQEHLPSLIKEPMRTPDSPDRCFQYVYADFCEHANKKFLVIVDAYSGWTTVWNFGDRAPTYKLINACRELFCQAAVPEEFFSDGGPQFKALPFINFLRRWGVKINHSSPYYHQSNGKAEAAVKSIKKVIRGAWDVHISDVDKDKLAQGLIQLRNTPMYDGRIPSVLVFGHPVRDTLPAHRRSFTKEWKDQIWKIEAKAARIHARVQERYNASKRPMAPLQVGVHVVLQNPVTKRWDTKGLIVEVGRHRDYMVKLASGRVLRRNRVFLRRCLPMEQLTDNDAGQGQTLVQNATDSPVSRRSQRPNKGVPPSRLVYKKLGEPAPS